MSCRRQSGVSDQSASARWRLTVFGGIGLTSGAGPAIGVAAQRRSLALLATLAWYRAQGVSREKLCALLWPEARTDQVRNRLKQAVYALRRELGNEAILGTVQLRLGLSVVTCDVGDFWCELDRGHLERAIQFFTGPFLDGFHIGNGGDEFERWADEQRRWTTARVVDALLSLAAAASGRGDPSSALDWWRRLAALDPLNARYARGVAMAELALGNRAGALRHIALYQDSLRRELELSIDADLQALVATIRTA